MPAAVRPGNQQLQGSRAAGQQGYLAGPTSRERVMSRPHDRASSALVVITREASSCLSSLSLSPTRLHASRSRQVQLWHEIGDGHGDQAASTAQRSRQA
jgi:hypothetical protein